MKRSTSLKEIVDRAEGYDMPGEVVDGMNFREVRDKYVNVKNPPTSTAVQVPGLFRPEFLVEIEAVAVVKAK